MDRKEKPSSDKKKEQREANLASLRRHRARTKVQRQEMEDLYQDNENKMKRLEDMADKLSRELSKRK